MERKNIDREITEKEVAALFSDPQWGARFPPLLTLDEAVAMLKISKQTIYDWSSRGRLDGCKMKVGKHLRLLRDRLIQKFFNEGTHGKR